MTNLDKDFKKLELSYKSYSFNVTELTTKEDDGQIIGIFSGSMATEDKDRGSDIIAPQAFDESLERYRKSNRNIRLFYQHNTREFPIGIIPIDSVKKSGKNWDVVGELNLDTQRGKDAYALLKQGSLSDLSIGFTILEEEFDENTRTIKQLELWEVSIVSEPMNPHATINQVKSSDGDPAIKYEIEDVTEISNKKELEEILRESGIFSRKAATYLASCFTPKQSESDKSQKVKSVLSELKALINKIKQ